MKNAPRQHMSSLRQTALFAATVVTAATLLALSSATAAEFIPLPRDTATGQDFVYNAVSEDGSKVVGAYRRKQAIANDPPGLPLSFYGMIWTREGGIETFYEQLGSARSMNIHDIAGDNNTVAASRHYYDPFGFGTSDLFLMNAGSITPLPLPDGHTRGRADLISRDGRVVVGEVSPDDFSGERFAYWKDGSVSFLDGVDARGLSVLLSISTDGATLVGASMDRAFAWTSQSGGQLLPFLSPGHHRSVAWDVTRDGRIIIGSSSDGTPLGNRAVRWDEFGNPTEFAPPQAGWGARAIQVTDDGQTVLGIVYPTNDPQDGMLALWREETGFLSLHDLLTENYGLGDEISGWDLLAGGNGASLDMSGDGRFILGAGANPLGASQSFLIDLGALVPGDFDRDQDVDGNDFLVWQRGLGSAHTAAELTLWRNNYGATAAGAAAVANTVGVPEPVSITLLGMSLFFMNLCRRRPS